MIKFVFEIIWLIASTQSSFKISFSKGAADKLERLLHDSETVCARPEAHLLIYLYESTEEESNSSISHV